MEASNPEAGIQITIIDDDPLVRDFAVHTIEYGINRKVTTFDNGFKAWQFLQDRPEGVDIIIADANIPDMDGLDLLDQVKKRFPHIKFVLTTSNPGLENSAYHMGADAFLSKPYDVDDLFAIVQQFISDPEPSTDLGNGKMEKFPHSTKQQTDQ
ncbi:MAG: response regulator [Desulfobacteraceae bacterium]